MSAPSALAAVEIKAFVPARDFVLSMDFYQALGFTRASVFDGIAYFRAGETSFLLQDFYLREHADNFQMHLLVDDVQAWHAQARPVAERFQVAIGEPTDQPWGMRDFTLFDPSGVLWRIAQNLPDAEPVGREDVPLAERSEDPEGVVREFWRLMATNDFTRLQAVLAEDLVVDWPQSNERLRGAQAFIRMNAEYPAHGPWRFQINRLVAGAGQVVCQVSVTDGVQSAEPVSFFTVVDGRVQHLLEYWPEPFAAPDNRRHLTEPIPPA